MKITFDNGSASCLKMAGLLSLLALVLAATFAQAHPAVSVVQDSRGNVYYSDLMQVWKLAPDGAKSVAVPTVHTHELCLDPDDNLFGEHLWYEGEATDKWGHRVWRLSADGELVDVIPAREGFLNDYSFVRDGSGNMYWADRGEQIVIRKRAPDGTITVHATGDFRDVRWMTAATDGTIFLIDRGDLRRISPKGELITLKSRLSARNPPPNSVRNRHYHMGLWTDRDGNVYVAVTEERVVLRVDAQGNTSVAARSPRGWAPTGGMIDRQGNLWLLEGSSGLFTRSKTRLRCIGRDGSEEIFD